ncbi:putative oxidoreductase [Gordonia namibiensis NBRC 108229]|uniref:Putative oxidoreductase n=1 Tax=Gordonia namibiensis NBRC 108229 TaxID=1208314 RepID=K6X8M2_9ACTN|nr:putative oxidoreductase [Gordonia namibiensis NBRC 108229]
MLIIASVREGRIGPTVADWFIDQIDPSDLDLEVLDVARASEPDTSELLARADGFVIATPEYNHSYPGHLKVLIDEHGPEWSRKPVMFVSYGGVSGGLRAVEHLRAVFAELHAVGTQTGVVIHAPWEHTVDGRLVLDEVAAASAREAMRELLWWAELLKPTRTSGERGAA